MGSLETAAVRQGPKSLPKGSTAINTGSQDACMICHLKSCTLAAHRLLNLDLLRRINRSEKKRKSSKDEQKLRDVASSHETSLSRPRISLLPLHSPITLADGLDHFIPFPIKATNRSTTRLFHSFFATQGGSLLESQRGLSFDSGHYPYLYASAYQNSALALSFVAMSATFQETQRGDLSSPSCNMLVCYAQAFEELRKKIDTERPGPISEATILAAVNLCMCCGISLTDTDAALLHWHGILALLGKPFTGIYSGAIATFVSYIEHWLVLIAALEPRNKSWPTLVPHENLPPRRYGGSLEILFASSILRDSPLSPKVREMCTNTCIATEVLEAHAAQHRSNSSVPMSTYYLYLRNVVAEQGAIIHSEARHTASFVECISLGLSLYYLLVMRRTPWKAPFRKLCSELRQVLSRFAPCYTDSDKDENSRCKGGKRRADLFTREIFHVERLAYNWMVAICACAARLCHHQPIIEWTEEVLGEVQLTYLECYGSAWEVALMQDFEKFVWSDAFLTSNLRTMWADRHRQRTSSL